MSFEENLFRLPVSGRVVFVSPLSGAEELLMAEAPASDAALAVALADRLARDAQGAPLDWRTMAVTDLDALIVFLRRMVLGDRVRADATCSSKECRQLIDVEFGLGEFLQHHAPVSPARSCRGWSVRPGQSLGWFRLAPPGWDGATAAQIIDFRLPTPEDQLSVLGRLDAEDELARRCLQPASAPVALRRKAEAAMEAMAPCLSDHLQAICPECGKGLTLYFEPRRFCLRELRDRTASIYADVDVLARRYHWSESHILSLPRARRVAYVELAQRAQTN